MADGVHVNCNASKEDEAKCVSLRSQKSPPNKAHAHLFNSLRSATPSHGPFIKLSVMAEWRFNMRHFYSLLFGSVRSAVWVSEFQTCNLAKEYLPLFFLTEPSIARKRSIIREVLLNLNLREHAIGCLGGHSIRRFIFSTRIVHTCQKWRRLGSLWLGANSRNLSFPFFLFWQVCTGVGSLSSLKWKCRFENMEEKMNSTAAHLKDAIL